MRLDFAIKNNAAALQKAWGAGPFVTFRYLEHPNGPRIWRARDHRKGLRPHGKRSPIWRSYSFNVAMAAGFAVGSMLFVVGAYLSLFPDQAHALSLSSADVNLVFFIGSVFFTLAAYLQLFQAANAAPHPGAAKESHRMLFGWRPSDPGWLASAVQFAGTLLFNVSTFYAMLGGNWLYQDLSVWAPDFIGSTLFLLSGYLTFVETCHKAFAWRPRELAWRIVMVNLLGCIAFMVSAFLAFVPAAGAAPSIVAGSTAMTFFGAVGFLVGSLLSIQESGLARVGQEE